MKLLIFGMGFNKFEAQNCQKVKVIKMFGRLGDSIDSNSFSQEIEKDEYLLL